MKCENFPFIKCQHIAEYSKKKQTKTKTKMDEWATGHKNNQHTPRLQWNQILK